MNCIKINKESVLRLGDKLLSKIAILKMKAKIKSKKEVAEGTLLVRFELLKDEIHFKPGQFFFVELPKLFYPDDKGNRRHFSIVNSPSEKTILSLTTRVRDTGFKKTLKELSEGTKVDVGPILGFFTLPDDTVKPLVFIALGIGITPYISMLRYIKENSLDYKITLIYSDSNSESMAYLGELEDFAKENPNFKVIMTITKDSKWKGEKRHVDNEFIKDYIPGSKNYTYYISGPSKAVEAVSKSLKESGMKDIKSEKFIGY